MERVVRLHKTFANGVANISQADLNKWVIEVHKRGFQAVIHTNADQATEMALLALAAASDNTRSWRPGTGWSITSS